jgi:uncharacterized protein (UPF0333 family)
MKKIEMRRDQNGIAHLGLLLLVLVVVGVVAFGFYHVKNATKTTEQSTGNSSATTASTQTAKSLPPGGTDVSSEPDLDW